MIHALLPPYLTLTVAVPVRPADRPLRPADTGTEAIPAQLETTMAMAVLLDLHIGARLLTKSKLDGHCFNEVG